MKKQHAYRFSISFVIRETQVESIVQSKWLKLKIMTIPNAGKDAYKHIHSHFAGGNVVGWYSQARKQFGSFLRKVSMQLPHNSSTALLGIPENAGTHEYKNYTALFAAAITALARAEHNIEAFSELSVKHSYHGMQVSIN